MKVAVYYNNKNVRIEERDKPSINDGEILVKTKVSGICGTDVMEWYRIKRAPYIPGHEMAGEVVESKNSKFRIGDRVFVSHHVPCEECKFCKEGNQTACETLHKGNYDPGGFSEFVRIPKINVEKGTYLLDSLSFEEGSMIEPLACCVNGQKVIDVSKNHKVLILGAGVSGLMNIMIAKNLGAYVIATDIDEWRLSKAKEFGADEVVDVSKEKLDVKADRIIICTGAMSAVKSGFSCMDKKAKMLFFAIPRENVSLPIVDFWRNEWTISSSYGAGPSDLKEALELIKNKKVDVDSLITHKIAFSDVQKGFDLVSEAKKSLKVVLEF